MHIIKASKTSPAMLHYIAGKMLIKTLIDVTLNSKKHGWYEIMSSYLIEIRAMYYFYQTFPSNYLY